MTVGLDGVLPRTTFYMGEGDEKHFYFKAKATFASVPFWERVFFFAAKRSAGIDMCPAAGALTLAMVLLMPWQPCHSGLAFVSTSSPKAQGTFFVL